MHLLLKEDAAPVVVLMPKSLQMKLASKTMKLTAKKNKRKTKGKTTSADASAVTVLCSNGPPWTLCSKGGWKLAGCHYQMISLGRGGGGALVLKDQQVRAIHIECDREVQFELKVLLSCIHTSEKNMEYIINLMRDTPKCHTYVSPTR